jgi:heat shock protein HslJ
MALLLSAVIVALGTTIVGTGSASAAPPVPGFVGKTYTSTAVTGEQIPGGGPLEVSFPAANRIALSAGCNRHIGDLRVDNSLLRLGSLASTMMACPGQRADADAWVTEFTKEPLTWYSVGHALVLVGPAAQVLLTEKPA